MAGERFIMAKIAKDMNLYKSTDNWLLRKLVTK